MKINLNLLPITINDDCIIPKDFLDNTSIIDLSKVHVSGKIYYDASESVVIDLDVSGVMVLLDAYTNEAIDYPFSFKINEIYEENEENLQKNEENCKNVLDIIEFLWENIVLEVPISYSKEKDVHLSGNGWQLNGEENKELSEFMKLDNLFKGGE